MDDTTLRPGRLLVASPALRDPNFTRTVVLLLEVHAEGALGLVLNRPSVVTVDETLPRWADRAATPRVVFVGGPVSPDSVIGLAEVHTAEPDDGWAPVDARVGTVDLRGDPAAIGGGVDTVRIFTGYAGWGPGQLEGEIAEGAWFVLDRVASDPWSGEPTGLWWSVLARQPGRLRWLAHYPADPTSN